MSALPSFELEEAVPKQSVMVLLVDDQVVVGEAIRRALLGESDIEFHYCSSPLEALAVASQLGFILGLAVVVGVLGGSYLDGRFGTSPIFLLVGSFTGMLVGIYTAWRTATFILAKLNARRNNRKS